MGNNLKIMIIIIEEITIIEILMEGYYNKYNFQYSNYNLNCFKHNFSNLIFKL